MTFYGKKNSNFKNFDCRITNFVCRFPIFIGFYDMFEFVSLSLFEPSLFHCEQFFRRLYIIHGDRKKKQEKGDMN